MVWLALSVAALVAGRRLLDVVLTLAGAWGLIILALTGAASLAHAARLRRDVRRALEAAKDEWTGREGMACWGDLIIPRRGWPLVLDPRIGWVHPRGTGEFVAEGERLRERVRCDARAATDRIVRAVLAEDIFRLWRIQWRPSAKVHARVTPDTGEYDRSTLERCISSGDLFEDPLGSPEGDRIDSRPYTRGDPARLILWKAYARCRRLLVRSPERARSPHEKPLLYLVSGRKDGAAAALAWFLLQDGLGGDGMRFACDGHPEATEDAAEIRQAILESFDARSPPGADLRQALEKAGFRDRGSLILIAPAVTKPWKDRVLPLIEREPLRTSIVAAADLGPASSDRSRLRDALFIPQANPDPSWEQVRTSLLALPTSCSLTLADRRSGKVMEIRGPAHAPAARVAS